jgi:hypothetical protein
LRAILDYRLYFDKRIIANGRFQVDGELKSRLGLESTN